MREPRAHDDARLGVGSLLDRRPERVQLGEHGALVVRDEEAHLVEAVGKTRRDAGLQLAAAVDA